MILIRMITIFNMWVTHEKSEAEDFNLLPVCLSDLALWVTVAAVRQKLP